MEDWLIGLFASFGILAFIFIFCKGLKGFSWDYRKYIRERNERGQRRRWNKYIKFLDPVKEEELLNIIKNSTDTEFERFLGEVKPSLKKKYRTYTLNDHTKLKRAMFNIINRQTTEFDYERVKKIEESFPMLKRVFFGPGLNKKVYNKKTLKRKFKFSLKPGLASPKLESIIDIAFFFNTTVNKILGLCYTQAKKPGPYYIKKEAIHKALIAKGVEPNQVDLQKLLLDSTFEIPEAKHPKKKELKQKNNSETEETPEETRQVQPSFQERSSPFYKRKMLIKPDGRKRLIASPVSYLKKYQRKILESILETVDLPNLCTGFVKNRSIVSNATIHVGSQTLVKIDLKNFFNSMKFFHAFEVFRGFGYNRPISGILACICTDWYTVGGRYVPQGAPSSPMIGNLYCKHLDKRLEGLWSKKGFVYSRYADDLTFSITNPKVKVRGLIYATNKIILDEKLIPNRTKTKVYRKQNKKSVTGITVNEKINIDRRWMNKFRGELYRYSKFGLPTDENIRNRVYNQLKGKLAFLHMVNSEKAEKYRPYLERIKLE